MPRRSPKAAPKTPPRDAIVTAALRVFAAHGVSGCSIQDVADAAKMSKQAVMHHFRTKELLREGVYQLLATWLHEQLPAAATELVSRSHDRYRGLIEVALQRLNADEAVARFLCFELLERPADVVKWLRREAAPWLGLIRGVVEQSTTPDSAFDAEAHVAVLAAMMLTSSALFPRGDKRWRARTDAAMLQVMLAGSNLA